MPLSDVQIRNARGREKPYKLTDRESLYLLVNPNGSRYWRYDFVLDGKRKTAAFGVYPAVSLREARDKLADHKAAIVSGQFKPKPPTPGARSIVTFKDVMSDWMARKLKPGASQATITKTEWLLNFFAPLYSSDITKLKPMDILTVLRTIEAGGRFESARRARGACSRIFRFAVATGLVERDICADLCDALTSPTVTHRAAPLTPAAIGNLMRGITSYKGHPSIVLAMRLGALTFVRPYELRYAVWEEFDLDNKTWRIPARRMKMRRDHIVPLSRQSLAVLAQLREIYEPTGLLFPSTNPQGNGPISENTINSALRSLGFAKDEATHHGFRRMASTTLNEFGWNGDWIEAQLAHLHANVRAVYNAAKYLPGRTQLMQAWADLLDEFETGEEDLIG